METNNKIVEFQEHPPWANMTVSPEHNKHDRMKLLGRKILFYMGVTQSRIKEEVTIEHNGNKYRVDLVGYPGRGDNFSIAIECGDNKAEKIEALRSTFPLVLILPYKEFDFLNEEEVRIIKKMLKGYEEQMAEHHFYLEQIRQLRDEFVQYKHNIDTISRDYKVDSITKIDTELSSTKRNLDDLKNEINDLREEIHLLKGFKEFCRSFSQMGVYS